VQDVLAVSKEGFHVYTSKWWNAVDALIILAFVVSYVNGSQQCGNQGIKWKPQNVAFIIAEVIFSSAIIMCFFHLTHILQVGDQITVSLSSVFWLNNKY